MTVCRVHKYLYKHTHTHIHTYIHTYIHTHARTHTHTHTHRLKILKKLYKTFKSRSHSVSKCRCREIGLSRGVLLCSTGKILNCRRNEKKHTCICMIQ